MTRLQPVAWCAWQGIGQAAAERFSREGFNVVIAARDPARVEGLH